MQTDNVYISPQLTYIECEHDYAFSFTDTPKNPSEYQRSMEERSEVMTEMLNSLKVKVGILQKELDEYKEREFDLEKFSDDDAAIQFYTGFQNYKSLMALFAYLEPKLSKLQFWGREDVKDSQAYQEAGKRNLDLRRK